MVVVWHWYLKDPLNIRCLFDCHLACSMCAILAFGWQRNHRQFSMWWLLDEQSCINWPYCSAPIKTHTILYSFFCDRAYCPQGPAHTDFTMVFTATTLTCLIFRTPLVRVKYIQSLHFGKTRECSFNYKYQGNRIKSFNRPNRSDQSTIQKLRCYCQSLGVKHSTIPWLQTLK